MKGVADPFIRVNDLFFIAFGAILAVVAFLPVLYAQEEGGAYVLELKDGLLSAELRDAEFGRVLEDIANRAGFQTDISPDVYGKKLSTTFESLELRRALTRMLALIDEKNYTIYYKPTGEIKEIQVGSAGPSEKPAPTLTPKRPSPAVMPVRPAPQATPPPQTAPPLSPPLSEEDLRQLQEMMDEPYPYIPPKEPPQYIPEKTK